MKKLYLVLILGVVLLGLISAENVAYVVNDELYMQQEIIDVLESSGYNVSLIYALDLDSVDWEEYNAIVVNGEKFGSDASKIPVNEIGSVVIGNNNDGLSNSLDIQSWEWGDGIGRKFSTIQPLSIPKWQNPSHELGNGLENPLLTYNIVQLSSSDYSLFYIKGRDKASGLKYVYVDGINYNGANGPTPINGGIVMAIDEGGLLKDNSRTNAKGVFFGIPRADLWSAGTEDVFLASVDWVITNRDEDGDGYNEGVDCDDNDASVWMTLEGYVDGDGDGYGVGSLVELCTDGNLPEGYSDVNGDCDDTDSGIWQELEGYVDEDEDGYGAGELVLVCSGEYLADGYSDLDGDCDDFEEYINPGVDEVPYDGLDNDCSEGDLTDVDGDGYDALVVGGEDCDDENAEVYPGAENPVNDCSVVGPIQIEEIPEQEWDEDGFKTLDLNDYFVSREGLILSYNVSNTSEDTNIVMGWYDYGVAIFQGSENWYGSDWIEFEVKDENNVSVVSNRIMLTVLPVNDAPEFNGVIGNYDLSDNNEWNELINLTEYFDDIDNETLEYSVEGNVDLEVEIVDGMLSVSYEEGYSGVEFVKIVASDGEYEVESNEFELRVNHSAAPVVNLVSPGNGVNIDNSKNVEFLLNIEDEDNENVECELFLDDVSEGKFVADVGLTEGIVVENVSNGDHYWKYVCSDEDNTVESEERTFRMNYYNAAPVVEILAPENETEFDSNDVTVRWNVTDDKSNELSCLVGWGTELNGEGLIENGDLEEVISENGEESSYVIEDLDNDDYYLSVVCNDGEKFNENAEIRTFTVDVPPTPHAPVLRFVGDKKVKVNETLEFDLEVLDVDENESFVYSATGMPSGAVLENGTFSWTPVDGQEGNYTLSFRVEDSSGLSNSKTSNIEVYSDGQTVIEGLRFDDADECSVFDENIKIRIKEPDDGDDFKVGDEIDIEVEIENNGEDDVDLDVTAYLYDLDEDEVVEDVDDSVDIKDGDDETVEMTLKVPSDVDSDNDYVLYVIAMEDKDEYCNSGYVELDIEKEKHKIEVDRMSIDRNEVSVGERVRVEFDLDNVGEEDEDVVIEIKNLDLGVDFRSEEYEIDSDDSERIITEFVIPEDAEEGSYVFDVRIVYDEVEDENFELSVSGSVEGDVGGVMNGIIKLGSGIKENMGRITGGVISGISNDNEDRVVSVNLGKNEAGAKSSNVKMDITTTNLILIMAILVILIVLMIVSIIRRLKS